MCIHKYFIYKQCGHSYFTPTPLIPCAARENLYLTRRPRRSSHRSSGDARVPEDKPCVPTAHPYRTLLIHTGLCLSCELRRAHALQIAQANIHIATFPERKWKIRYTTPSKHGLEGAFPEGGWADGSDLDVNGFVKREDEARRSKEAKELSGKADTGSPESATSWKTSHRPTVMPPEVHKPGALAGMFSRGGWI